MQHYSSTLNQCRRLSLQDYFTEKNNAAGKTHKDETLPWTLIFPNKLNCASRMTKALSSTDLHILYIPLLLLILLITPAIPCSLFSLMFLSISSSTSTLGLPGSQEQGWRDALSTLMPKCQPADQGQWIAKLPLLFIPPTETLTWVLSTRKTLKFTKYAECCIFKTTLLCWIVETGQVHKLLRRGWKT